MARFYPLKIKALTRETETCTSVMFDCPAEWEEVFRFKQGQHLTLRATINGQEVRRNYSLCSSPAEKALQVAVKQIEGGAFSTFVHQQLAVGDTLEVMPPGGRFYTELHPDQARQYVAFAAGSGITPVMSILKSVLETEPDSQFTLFYLNRDSRSIIFREALEGLKNRHLNRLQVYHFLSREERDIPLFNGRFSAEKLDILLNKLVSPAETDAFFLCGPEAMIFEVRDTLMAKGVPAEKIHFELFSTATPRDQQARRASSSVLKGSCEVMIKDGGKQFGFTFEPGTESLLDAALQRGADLPFACKGGVCCTCKAKLLEGKVEMDANYALEPEEVEAGFVLACQSHPLTNKIVLDFDSAL
jgi:ring-1,2-phenylacetyl-CoA epoxidase subunit PaaE